LDPEKDKKSYEISQLSHLIADVCQTTGTNHVIDVGAGKGYLSTFLSAEFGLEVTAIDCVKNNLEKTLERAKSLEKHFHHRSNQADEKVEKKSTEVKIECVGDVVRQEGSDSENKDFRISTI
jgi:2-polyprenyl-3-methyl-5-hydroxy-6-metoxy-1,4-benzoquinol methylase